MRRIAHTECRGRTFAVPGIHATQGAAMTSRAMAVVLVGLVGTFAGDAGAQDWPQWRGPNRDAKVTGFHVPATWPKDLTKKWKVTVGDGVATPALVGDRLYAFARQDDQEVTTCLDANTGK